MKNIAIIPARGESKRIPRKNIKIFLGKPIIAYSIEAALKSKLFDEVIVSTDDEEIAKIAKKYGAKVPFMRSSKMSDDYATISNVIEEVLFEYKQNDCFFDNFCCLLPTAPLLRTNTIIDSYNLFNQNNFDSVFPVVRFSYPIQRALRNINGNVKMANIKHIHTRSQDLEPMFHDAGLFYWIKIKVFEVEKELFCLNSGMIELQELEIQDIDTLEDWKLAELKYQLLSNKR